MTKYSKWTQIIIEAKIQFESLQFESKKENPDFAFYDLLLAVPSLSVARRSPSASRKPLKKVSVFKTSWFGVLWKFRQEVQLEVHLHCTVYYTTL